MALASSRVRASGLMETMCLPACAALMQIPGFCSTLKKAPMASIPGSCSASSRDVENSAPTSLARALPRPGSPSTMSGSSVCGCLLNPRTSGTAEYQWSSPMIANLMEVTSSPQIASRPRGDRVSEEYLLILRLCQLASSRTPSRNIALRAVSSPMSTAPRNVASVCSVATSRSTWNGLRRVTASLISAT